MPKIIETDNFKSVKHRLDNSQLIKLEKLIIKIIENPEVGKPMRNIRKGTRELYSNPFRLSYSFDKATNTIFLLDFYHKDKQ